MTSPACLIVPASAAGTRADRFLAEHFPGAGRRSLARAFDEGEVRVNGRRARKGDRLAAADVVELAQAPARGDELAATPEPELPLTLLYADARLVAVAKAAGVPSTTLRAGETGTLANALVARHPECALAGADPREAGLAHRLDTGTSGVLVAARDRETWHALRAAFHDGRVAKEYLALVVGEAPGPGECCFPIAHDRAHEGTMRAIADPEQAYRRGALPAETWWVVEREYAGFTLLRCHAASGRMHQVRVHLAAAGYPVVGDARYGGDAPAPTGLVAHFLHADRLVLPHPDDGRPLTLHAPLPPDRATALAALAER